MRRRNGYCPKASRASARLAFVLCSVLLIVGCAKVPTQAELYAYRLPSAGAPYVAKSELDARIEFLEKRLKGRSKAFLDQAELAGLYLQKGKLRQRSSEIKLAEKWAETSMKEFANNPARQVQADLLQMEHKFEESLSLLGRILAEEPGNESARVLAVRALLAQGKPQQAQEVLKPIEGQPLFALSFLQGQIFESEGRLEDAAAMYQRSLRRELATGSPLESARLRAVWARLEIRRGNLELAEQLLAAAKAIPVDLPLVEMERAELAEVREHYPKAAEILRSAYALYHDPAFLLKLAMVQKVRGQEEESVETLKATIASLENAPYGHEKDLAKAYLELDAGEHRDKILALMKSELGRRRDVATMEVWREVQRALGPLPEPAPFSQENPITQAPLLQRPVGQRILPTSRSAERPTP